MKTVRNHSSATVARSYVRQCRLPIKAKQVRLGIKIERDLL